MHIALITPYGAETQSGNWHTATRWAGLLKQAGHRVEVSTHWNGEAVDLMIALHARRSALSIQAFAAWQPQSPLIVVLTGTDLYRDIRTDTDAQQSLQLATRLVVLQEKGLEELAPELQDKSRIIYQSAPDIAPSSKTPECFDVLCIGHLREEKDPFRPALAATLLPQQSSIRITHLGGALSAEIAQAAHEMQEIYPRWTWADAVPHEEVLTRLSRAHLLVVSSHMEGGANVICEALAASVPVIASDISGNIGMLGQDYPGYYPVGNETRLAQLLARAETDPGFYAELVRHCSARRSLMTPEQEADSLKQLIGQFAARPER